MTGNPAAIKAAAQIGAWGREAGLLSPGPAAPQQLAAVSLLAPEVNRAAAGEAPEGTAA